MFTCFSVVVAFDTRIIDNVLARFGEVGDRHLEHDVGTPIRVGTCELWLRSNGLIGYVRLVKLLKVADICWLIGLMSH